MTNERILQGRLVLSDPSRRFSRLGVFENRGDQQYICFERVSNSQEECPVYLVRNSNNEFMVNKQVSPGDIVRITGDYRDISGQRYFIGESAEVISKCTEGRKSGIFELSAQVKSAVEVRAKLLKNIRASFESRGFMEVTTPILLPFYEGGDASPFQTADQSGNTLYLKETNELILRRLASCGVGPVYEIGRSFRNIGVNKSSLQEFTVVESAIPYASLEEGIQIAEDLIRGFLDENTSKKEKWRRIGFPSAYKEINKADYLPKGDYSTDRSDLASVLSSIQGDPAFLIGLPHETSPINARNKTTLNEAALVINGDVFCDVCEFEVSRKGLESRLKEQEKRTKRINQSFLDFASYGLVPGVGIAFGLERWIKYLSGADISQIRSLGGVI